MAELEGADGSINSPLAAELILSASSDAPKSSSQLSTETKLAGWATVNDLGIKENAASLRILGANAGNLALDGFRGEASATSVFLCEAFQTSSKFREAYEKFSMDSAEGDKSAERILIPLRDQGVVQASYLLASIYTKVLSHRSTYFSDNGYAPAGVKELFKVWQSGHYIGSDLFSIMFPFHFYNNCLDRPARDKLISSNQLNMEYIIANKASLFDRNPKCIADAELWVEGQANASLAAFLYDSKCPFDAGSYRCQVWSILTKQDRSSVMYAGSVQQICAVSNRAFLRSAELGDRASIDAGIAFSATDDPALEKPLEYFLNASDQNKVRSCEKRDFDLLRKFASAGRSFFPDEGRYTKIVALTLADKSPSMAAELLYTAAKQYSNSGQSAEVSKIYDIFLEAEALRRTLFFGLMEDLIRSRQKP